MEALRNEIQDCAAAFKLGKVLNIETFEAVNGFKKAIFDTDTETNLSFYYPTNKF